MKNNYLRLIITIIFIFITSCDEPVTVVTNIVHTDGSVTRKLEMRSSARKSSDRFKLSGIQVPFDSTWTVRDSLETSEKGDTTWVRRAEKLFKNSEEINSSYKVDSGANHEIIREAAFARKFRWFNTEFRFAEKVYNKMQFGYPVADFLDDEELDFFYSPESIKDKNKNSPDSLRYRVLEDTIQYKTDYWLTKSLVSEWFGIFAKHTEGRAGSELSYEALKTHEDKIVKMLTQEEINFDSLWSEGILLRELIGDDYARKFKNEADSSLEIVTNNLMLDFKEYSMRFVMPGKVTATNGFIDSSNGLLWPVKSDYFLTEPYVMWAESKVANWWVWIVSGLFIAFVLVGLIVRVKRKAEIFSPFLNPIYNNN